MKSEYDIGPAVSQASSGRGGESAGKCGGQASTATAASLLERRQHQHHHHNNPTPDTNRVSVNKPSHLCHVASKYGYIPVLETVFVIQRERKK